MSQTTIRADLKEIIEAVDNVGIVHDYERWASEWPDFLNLFKVSINGQNVTRGWEITFRGWDPGDLQEFNPGRTRSYNFEIFGYFGLKDADETEKSAAEIAEAVADALDASATLHDGGTYFETSHADLDFGPLPMAKVLVHRAMIRLTITEFKT